ncbi:MAG: hypothetical protein F6K18_28215 [Okeania sp. SIO2C2]|nr:hypothetical protein [Okeania sp. SIO2C2]
MLTSQNIDTTWSEKRKLVPQLIARIEKAIMSQSQLLTIKLNAQDYIGAA